MHWNMLSLPSLGTHLNARFRCCLCVPSTYIRRHRLRFRRTRARPENLTLQTRIRREHDATVSFNTTTTMRTRRRRETRRTKTENGERCRQLLRLQYWKLCAAAARRTEESPALSRSDHALFRPSPPAAGGMRRRSRATAPRRTRISITS